jgi:hypothetical protein
VVIAHPSTDLAFGKKMANIRNVPYSKYLIGFVPVEGSEADGVYCCALDKQTVLDLSKEDTISLRNFLEQEIALQLGRPMELGYACYALAPNMEEVVVAFFRHDTSIKNTMEKIQ